MVTSIVDYLPHAVFSTGLFILLSPLEPFPPAVIIPILFQYNKTGADIQQP